MVEVGADTTPISIFLESVSQNGISWALENCVIPPPSKEFMQSTFGIIQRGNAHEIAAAFTYGRETVIPQMFRRLVKQLDINSLDASRFLHYLDRHIEVDGEEHGPASLKLIQEMCDYDPIKIVEAEQSAVTAIKARILFWDRVEEQL
jgi:pyrroloquinoline quinone (PQQ) biosynthesis protein C